MERAGSTQSNGQQHATRNHAPGFWTSVATKLKGYSNAIFDLYNEPYPSSWSCLLNGGNNCGASFAHAGMQSRLNAVRATGATNPVMVGGLGYAHDLSQWPVLQANRHDGITPGHRKLAQLQRWHRLRRPVVLVPTTGTRAGLSAVRTASLICGHCIDSVVWTMKQPQ